MAKRRKNNDSVMLYTIIGIVTVIIGLSIALVISNIKDNQEPVEEPLDYSDFAHLSDFDTLDQMPEGDYAVYYYQQSCGGCLAIKEDVLNAAESNDSNYKIYLMDAMNTTGDRLNVDLNGEQITSTPTMLVYNDGELVDILVSGTEILPFIEDVEDGKY